MRIASLVALVGACALMACTNDPRTSTFDDAVAKPSTTSETKSDSLPSDPATKSVAVTPSENNDSSDAGQADAGSDAAPPEEEGWWKDCLPFVPCFPPDPPPPEDACPPFDPVCQTNAALK